MQIEKIAIEQLIPADYNPRKDLKPGDPEYDKLKRSIESFGYVEPLIWNKVTGRVVGGHQRLKVLLDMGMTEVDCVVVELDEEKEKALNIALNKISGEWDKDKLALLIADLQGADFDVSLTGFEPAEIDDLFKESTKDKIHDDDFDVDAELEKPIMCKPGDVWTLGRHRLVCGDSTKAETYDTLMNGVKANLVVTDPPYNVNYEGSAGKIKNDSMANDKFYEFLLAAFKNTEAVMADDASIYCFHSDTEGLNFRRAFADAGFFLSGCCIWKKQSLVLGRSPYQWQHEPVLFGWKKKGKHQLARRYTDAVMKFYCFCDFDRNDQWDADFWQQDVFDLFTRIEILMRNRCLPYVMRFARYTESPYRGVYVTVARWCNQPRFFKKKSLREFAEFNGKDSACYRYLWDFEKRFPEVARFYDMKYK